jgi:hypothetical protein
MFKKNWKQGYIGIEAAEEYKKDARYIRRRAEHNAKDRIRENEHVSKDLCREHIIRYKEVETARRRKEIEEHMAEVVVKRRRQGLIAPASANYTPTPDVEDADNMGALVFPSNIEIKGPSRIEDHFITSSSNELLDLLIT